MVDFAKILRQSAVEEKYQYGILLTALDIESVRERRSALAAGLYENRNSTSRDLVAFFELATIVIRKRKYMFTLFGKMLREDEGRDGQKP